MYCYRCGQRLADSARHCPNCGAAIFYNENGPLNGEDGADCDACADEGFGSAYSTHDPNKVSTGTGYGSDSHYVYDPQTGSYRAGGSENYGGESGYSYGTSSSGYQTPGSSYSYGSAGNTPSGGYRPANTKQDGFALAALICAIASLICCCVPQIGLIVSIGAVVFGILGLKAPQRKSMAMVGLVLGGIMLLINGVLFFLSLYLVSHPELLEEWMQQMQEIIGESGEFNFR